MANLSFLLIEFLDEFVFGVTEGAWPFIQSSLQLNYTQIGLLITIPGLVATIVEPFLGILGDVWKRRALILGGGIVFTISLLLTSASSGFWLLLISFCLFYPASGAFVSLSQATYMDSEPTRHDQNMARWTFAGSLGVTVGPLLLIGLSALGFGWRGAFLALGLIAGIFLLFVWRRIPRPSITHPYIPRGRDIYSGFIEAFRALRRGEALRWLILLQFSDLMLDVLLGFLALYFFDVAGLSEPQAAGAVWVWLAAGLAGDLLLIPLLERLDGLRYLRWSVILELILFPAFLLMPWIWAKLVLAGLLGFFNSGWYAILKGRLYSALPGKSASVMALENVVGLAGGFIPLGIGMAADAFGLQAAIWLLLAGPIALFLGLPRTPRKNPSQDKTGMP